MSTVAELFAGHDFAYDECVAALSYVVQRDLRAKLDEVSSPVLIDVLLAELNHQINDQVDAILHAPAVQSLESAWRSLAFVMSRVDHDNNIITEILPCTKEELYNDLMDSPDVIYSGFYDIVYSKAIGRYGGIPYGLICASYEFGPGYEDIALLEVCASIAAMAHAPFITNATPSFFGAKTFGSLPALRDLEGIFDNDRFAAWRSFQSTEDSRYVGLCLPRFLLRPPHDIRRDPAAPMRHREKLTGERDLLWGSTSMLFAIIAAGSFARFRWCVYLTGSRAAKAAPLPRWDYESLPGIWTRCPLECVITTRLERALSECGFISFVFEREGHQACMLSAPAVAAGPLDDAEGLLPTPDGVSRRMGAQINYTLLVCRLAHYLKCVQLQKVGSETDRAGLERELHLWIRRYVSDMEDPAAEVLAAKPLRSASLAVEAIDGQPGWYRCNLRIRPHMTHNNASFTLALVGKLDRPLGSQIKESPSTHD